MKKIISVTLLAGIALTGSLSLTGCMSGSEIGDELTQPIDAGLEYKVQTDVKNTVAAIQTWLVQNPNASDVSQAPVSDTSVTDITVSGSWDDFTVTGKNGVYTYSYDSSTGSYS